MQKEEENEFNLFYELSLSLNTLRLAEDEVASS